MIRRENERKIRRENEGKTRRIKTIITGRERNTEEREREIELTYNLLILTTFI